MDHDDFDHEPVHGLPQRLPPGETMLWQGAPSARALARDALRVRWAGAWFALLYLWRVGAGAADRPLLQSAWESAFLLILGALVVGLLWAVAWAQARATVYTITDRRVVMRVGAALTMTVQFPFQWIGAADVRRGGDGTGTIALRTTGETRFSYLLLWPHARPWRVNPPQPALRCIPDVDRVARLLAEAVADHGAMPQIAVTASAQPRPAPAPAAGGAAIAAE